MKPVPMRLRFVTEEGVPSEDMELGEQVILYNEFIAVKVYGDDWFVIYEIPSEPTIHYDITSCIEFCSSRSIPIETHSKRRRKYWEPPKYF